MKPWLYFLFYIVILPLATAAEWSVDGSIKQTLSFDDNVRMAKKAQGSFIYQLSPEINFSRKTKMSGISVGIDYGIQRYLNIKELDHNLQKYTLESFYSTPRIQWELALFFSIAPARNTAEQDSGDFASQATKITRAISPQFSYKLTERDHLSLSPHYSKITYSSNDFSHYENSNISFAWKRQWSERYSSSISYFYSSFDSVGLTRKTKSYSQGINFSSTYQWLENLQQSSTLGIRITQSENTRANGLENHSDIGFLSSTKINYTGENYKIHFNLSRSLVPSNQGQLNEQTRLSLRLNYNMTERLFINTSGRYQQSQLASSLTNENNARKNFSSQVALNWKMTPMWTISANYRYRQQNRARQVGTRHSNSLMLSIDYNWQGLSVAR